MTFISLIIFNCSYAQSNTLTPEEKNINIVKNMFSEFAEKLDVNKFDEYYSKDFILESNNQTYDAQAYKNLEQKIYKTLTSLKVTNYKDIFVAGDKVVSRMTIKLTHKDGKANEFDVILIALIKDNKINKIWEITYPSWSDKLTNK